MFVNLLFNMAMLIPLGILCKISRVFNSFVIGKIISKLHTFTDQGILERQNQLNEMLGELEMEKDSFEKAQWMAWIFYPIFILLSILQAVSFFLSNGKFHPLAKILEGHENQQSTPE